MFEVIITKGELYDKCENVEQLYDNFYYPLLVEYKELKKQVESYKKLGFKHLQDKNNNLETQQKEFIEWLEAMSVMYENEYKDIDVADHYNCALQKYKEIIGVSDENN